MTYAIVGNRHARRLFYTDIVGNTVKVLSKNRRGLMVVRCGLTTYTIAPEDLLPIA